MTGRMDDAHLILLGEINGKVDMLVARAVQDDKKLDDAVAAGWFGKGALLLVIASYYPKAREIIGPLFGL